MKAEAIHMRFHQCRNERAEFLWNMYRRHSHLHGLRGFYLDIGTGNLANATVFRRRARLENAIGIDIRNEFTRSEDVMLVRADGRMLPFRARSFELVTMISFIEHVQEPSVCLSEALRVIDTNGELFLQLPNRYFPIELHSGLYIYFYLPKFVRNWLADSTGRRWIKGVDIPSLRKIRTMLGRLEPVHEVVTEGFSYPESLLPESKLMRALHHIMKHLGVFRIFPMGYIVLARVVHA
jgi:ubiquinone/menaquinone biosynthesis C-methylase UbiE